MKVVSSRSELQSHRRAMTGTVGLVPTMGALHAGHLSLVETARRRADHVFATIFVNPTQFAPHEDFEKYPRGMEADLAAFRKAGVDLVYTPAAAEIYPDGPKVTVRAGPAAEGLESLSRPHFFDGVCSVVATLFEHTAPDIAVFGEKDFQQLKVIEQMVAMLSLPIEIVAGETVRDEAGLALSSRNSYLSPQDLETARSLNRILRETVARLRKSTDGAPGVLNWGEDALRDAGFETVDYLEQRWNRLLAAVTLGSTRLIDNVPVQVTGMGGKEDRGCV